MVQLWIMKMPVILHVGVEECGCNGGNVVGEMFRTTWDCWDLEPSRDMELGCCDQLWEN